eukprot:CAMPEP_0119107630 /NCGR_PEP_ID=MMETSP1180-20130426/11512_1 /TAXON_ID=3052 ORGANISM="Chlamydomonas cf sp, Strain CCMP681" /NCGR_SAMPLE_ID=MMETSP1180 /ASSEMBLY_ACC=CAM_ASM_000741 /LENGTH=603 /DNA_ID=CAMNT_0007093147 /DNA_START=8 /DNA_END=1819 /DNA_ORIENTATION=-
MARRATVLLLAVALLGVATAEIKLQSVERKINLASQFARITETLKVKNNGDLAVDRATVCHAKQTTGSVAFQKVTQVLASKYKLKISPVTLAGAPAEAVCWEVVLKEPVAAGQATTLELFTVYSGVQTAYPAQVSQGEQQLMLFIDNLYVLSPYQVSTQTTEVQLPNARVESYTNDEKPVAKAESKIKYGKYDLIKPWTLKPLRVHFENDKAFKEVVTCVREIEVSHWGNIYVEESYELKNGGANHTGAFSRLKYAHTYNGKGNSFQDLKARLPPSAHSLYYVDLIGNISTSTVRKTTAETSLDFKTRYPLQGGWKVDFKIGYSVNLKGFLGVLKGGKRRLSMDFNSPLEGVLVKDLIVRIVLPEGAKDITAALPYAGIERTSDIKYTYLDVAGRPVIVLHMTDVVPEHSAPVHIDYNFAAFSVLREPLMLITAFAAMFLMAIVYNHMDFTIAKTDKWQASQEADKLATTMQEANQAMEAQDAVLDALAKLVSSVHGPEDAEAISKDKTLLESNFTVQENKVKALVSSLASAAPKAGERVSALQDRLRALQLRYIKLLVDRCDLVRKGATGSEASKKLSPISVGLQEGRTELAAAVEGFFAPY